MGQAFVFASVDEDFGITPVEAMAMGKAIVASRVGGLKEIIRDGQNGLLCDELRE